MTDNNPNPKPPKSLGTKIALGCLGVIVFSVVSIGLIILSLILSSQRYGESPTPPPSVSSLAPQADSYLKLVQANDELLPSFGDFMSAVYNRGLPCLDSYESPDVCLLVESKSFKNQNTEEICTEVIGFAKELGATEDSIPGDKKMMALSDDSTNRCVTALHSYPRSVGWGWFSPSYFLQGKTSSDTPFAIQLSMEQDSPINALEAAPPANRDPKVLQAETFKYSLITSTNFDTPDPIDIIPDYSDSKIQVAALLDTVAYYRRSNPDLPIFDPVFAQTMIDQYKRSFRFDGMVEPYVSNGQSHWIHFNDGQGFEVCVSTGANRSELSSVDEYSFSGMLESGLPGKGDQLIELGGLGEQVSSIGSGHPFGSYVLGSCK